MSAENDVGTVAGIHITSEEGGAMRSVASVRAHAGRGLEGDRYAFPAGDAGKTQTPDKQITLIAAEAIEAIGREHGIELEAKDSRRNILTRGVALEALIGREFEVGDVRLRGLKSCDPCGYLERTAGKPGLVTALARRGGLRAEILSSGLIRVGDRVRSDG